MATESEPVVPVEVEGTSAAPDAANPPVPEVQPTPATTTPAPVAPAHDPWLVHQAKQLTIPQEIIDQMTPAELNRSVILLTQQQARLAQSQAAAPAPKPTEPAPEPEWDLPAEAKAKLAELDPAIAEAIAIAGRAGIDRAKRAEAELAKTRQQVSGQEFGARVNAEMSKIAGLGAGVVKEGSPEHAKRNAVLNHLAYLEQTGQLNGVSPEVAIPMAYKTLFGESQAAGAKPAPPAPTTSARPSKRLQGDGAGLSARELLLKEYQDKLDKWDAEESVNADRNGSFRP